MSQPTHHSIIVSDDASLDRLNALYAEGYLFVAACGMPSSLPGQGAYILPIRPTCLVTLRTPPSS